MTKKHTDSRSLIMKVNMMDFICFSLEDRENHIYIVMDPHPVCLTGLTTIFRFGATCKWFHSRRPQLSTWLCEQGSQLGGVMLLGHHKHPWKIESRREKPPLIIKIIHLSHLQLWIWLTSPNGQLAQDCIFRQPQNTLHAIIKQTKDKLLQTSHQLQHQHDRICALSWISDRNRNRI